MSIQEKYQVWVMGEDNTYRLIKQCRTAKEAFAHAIRNEAQNPFITRAVELEVVEAE
jgi:hypothetical protein